MHNFYFLGLCILSAITSSFGGENITVTNSNSAIYRNGTDHPLNSREVFGDIGWGSSSGGDTKRDSEDSFAHLVKRQTGPDVQTQLPPHNSVGFVIGPYGAANCMGTLIAPNHVLVPASCIHRNQRFVFALKTRSTRSDEPIQDFRIRTTLVHDLWKRNKDKNYDLGLIVLEDCPLPVRRMELVYGVKPDSRMEASMITWLDELNAIQDVHGKIYHSKKDSDKRYMPIRLKVTVGGSILGSPIYFRPEGDDTKISGIITLTTRRPGKDGRFSLRAGRVTKEKYDLLWDWIKSTPHPTKCTRDINRNTLEWVVNGR